MPADTIVQLSGGGETPVAAVDTANDAERTNDDDSATESETESDREALLLSTVRKPTQTPNTHPSNEETVAAAADIFNTGRDINDDSATESETESDREGLLSLARKQAEKNTGKRKRADSQVEGGLMFAATPRVVSFIPAVLISALLMTATGFAIQPKQVSNTSRLTPSKVRSPRKRSPRKRSPRKVRELV